MSSLRILRNLAVLVTLTVGSLATTNRPATVCIRAGLPCLIGGPNHCCPGLKCEFGGTYLFTGFCRRI